MAARKRRRPGSPRAPWGFRSWLRWSSGSKHSTLPRRRRPAYLSPHDAPRSATVIHTTRVTLSPADVLARATAFFAERVPQVAAFVEKEGPGFVVLRGQGGEEVAIRAWPDDEPSGLTRVRASTLFFDQAVDRFLSTLPLAAVVEVA